MRREKLFVLIYDEDIYIITEGFLHKMKKKANNPMRHKTWIKSLFCSVQKELIWRRGKYFSRLDFSARKYYNIITAINC